MTYTTPNGTFVVEHRGGNSWLSVQVPSVAEIDTTVSPSVGGTEFEISTPDADGWFEVDDVTLMDTLPDSWEGFDTNTVFSSVTRSGFIGPALRMEGEDMVVGQKVSLIAGTYNISFNARIGAGGDFRVVV